MRTKGDRTTAGAAKPPRTVAALQRQLDELAAELRARTAERDVALAQQMAAAEVLQVINSSPGDLGPVFEAILEKAINLCGAAFGALGTWQGDRMTWAALRGPKPIDGYLRNNEAWLGSRRGFARLAKGEGYVQFADIATSKFYQTGDPHTRALVDIGGGRSTLAVPLAKDDEVVGLLCFYRQEVRPFSEREIALVKTFASQAVIAMENARLLGELRKRTDDLEVSLEYQTATSDVLKVISRRSSCSPSSTRS